MRPSELSRSAVAPTSFVAEPSAQPISSEAKSVLGDLASRISEDSVFALAIRLYRDADVPLNASPAEAHQARLAPLAAELKRLEQGVARGQDYLENAQPSGSTPVLSQNRMRAERWPARVAHLREALEALSTVEA